MNSMDHITSFKELVSTAYYQDVNAMCWRRELTGNFFEIVSKLERDEDIVIIEEDELRALKLTNQGNLARTVLLNDLKLLENHGALPTLNLIKQYERDDAFPFFPTDVYSYHVDRSPIPIDTFLCTYHGAASDILPNDQAQQKILVPEIRLELRKLYDGEDEGFESFLSEYFFDLHYQALPNARPINLGVGHMWKLATDHPNSKVLPCIHRAPEENDGKIRLMIIC